ncbi:hypothetical protein AKJ16_DCAP06138 [Drosera capensis]
MTSLEEMTQFFELGFCPSPTKPSWCLSGAVRRNQGKTLLNRLVYTFSAAICKHNEVLLKGSIHAASNRMQLLPVCEDRGVQLQPGHAQTEPPL